MGVEQHLDRMFNMAGRIFGETGIYEQQGSPAKQIKEVIVSKEAYSNTSGTTAKVKKAIVKQSEIAQPVYNDKITIAGVKWTVDSIEKTAPGQWELTLRNDEKLVY